VGHPELVSGHHRRPAAVATLDPGRSQPGGCAFADQVAFELGQSDGLADDHRSDVIV
jgi:hypothetical protein